MTQSSDAGRAWVNDANAAMLIDLYELTMAQAYLRQSMTDDAVFDLFVRRLPPERNFLIACGLQDALHFLETMRFSDDAVAYLRTTGHFDDDFLGWLKDFRFTGDVRAVAEGTPVFPGEPIMQVSGPIAETQLAETFLLNQVHVQTLMASKAARVVEAAQGRTVVDFGLRRMHGTDAGMKAARAYAIVGVHATSNVLAGQVYGIPISGTMAHSYIQAQADEEAAFAAFVKQYPDTTLLVDTYDTIEGVQRVIDLARTFDPPAPIGAIRLDSGDLGDLARRSRAMLDEAGLEHIKIFASGGLDEHAIASLLDGGAPIDGFGVGSKMSVSEDAPILDIVYKLTAYASEPRMKLSAGKSNLPGRKQIYRIEQGGVATRDMLALEDEQLDGTPLLEPVMKDGHPLTPPPSLATLRDRCRAMIAALPPAIRSLDRADPGYPVTLSEGLEQQLEHVRRQLEAASHSRA